MFYRIGDKVLKISALVEVEINHYDGDEYVLILKSERREIRIYGDYDSLLFHLDKIWSKLKTLPVSRAR